MPEQTTRVSVPSNSLPVSEAPTGVRYRVLAFLCGLSMITYLDRVCFGAAAPAIAGELNLASVAELKWAFTAFSIAYAIFEIPAGWFGDRLGPRGMLIRIVLWWSLFTALTGLVGVKVGSITMGGLGMMILVRFFFGAGEAGAYPNIARAIQNWFPERQWEMAQGMIWMSGRLAGGLTPLIWAVLVSGTSQTAPLTNWRGAFLGFGMIGLAWCVAFTVWFRNRPDDHSAVNEAERAEIGSTWKHHTAGHAGVPWGALLTNPSLLALCLMYSLVNYGWAFNITYLPSYLEQRFLIAGSDLSGAIYKGSPLWVGAFGCLSGGLFVNFFSKRLGSRRQGRQAVGIIAMIICALSWLGAQQAPNVHIFAFFVSLAAFCIDATLGAIWATCQDLGRQHTAVTAAFMNTIGTLGSALAAWGTGTLVQRAIVQQAVLEHVPVTDLTPAATHAASMNGFQFVFLTYAAVYIVAALCWLVIDPRRTIGRETPPE